MEFFKLSIQATCEKLGCGQDGLSSSEIAERLLQYGPNEIESEESRHIFLLFLDQFKSFIIYILLFAVVFSIAIGEYIDCLIILAILLANAFIGFFQELSAAKSLAALKKLTSVKATVLRGGKSLTVDAKELVPGDIVTLRTGDKVPADARIISSASLAVDEASLTGESLPVAKKSDVIAEHVQLGEQYNMVFSSTSVVGGNGRVIVCATGMKTEIGKITKLVKEATEELTPLQHKLDVFGRKLGSVIIAICLFVLLASCIKEFMAHQLISSQALVSFAFIAISLAVAAVPTALPAVVTIALSIGVKRLLRRKALVRKLSSVETLGSCDVICTDKTGTLTRNEMTVRHAWTPDMEVDFQGVGYAPQPKLAKQMDVPLFRAGMICNNSSLLQEDVWKVNGNPTEGALLVSAMKAGCRIEAKRVAELPFDSDRKCMSVLVEESDQLTMYTKGAPDSIVDKCSHVLSGGHIISLDTHHRAEIMQQNDLYASKAMRVLAFACKEVHTKGEFVENGLVFVGLQAMIDPPRDDVQDSISLTGRAGIRVIMITGDYPETARAIGREVGIESQVLTGTDMGQLDDQQLRQRLDSGVNIFARVVPEHKQRIVTALQQSDHVVAMTGDGVNDAPALKKANIGIAVGSGTEVAKEASDFVLMDDSFSHIVKAIEEGRGIYDNIQKSIMLLLSGNLGEVLIIFLAVIVGLNLPLTAIMLLWINMVTDGAPALAYSVDTYGKDIMHRQPKPLGEGILPKPKLMLIASLGSAGTLIALVLFAYYGGNSPNRADVILAQTMVFNFVVLYEVILVFIIRYGYQVPFFSNPYIWLSVFLSISLQALIMYTPLHIYFKVAPLASEELIVLFVAALGFYLIFLMYHRFITRSL